MLNARKGIGEVIVFLGVVIGLLLPFYLMMTQENSFDDVQGFFIAGVVIAIFGGFVYRSGKTAHNG